MHWHYLFLRTIDSAAKCTKQITSWHFSPITEILFSLTNASDVTLGGQTKESAFVFYIALVYAGLLYCHSTAPWVTPPLGLQRPPALMLSGARPTRRPAGNPRPIVAPDNLVYRVWRRDSERGRKYPSVRSNSSDFLTSARGQPWSYLSWRG